MKNKGFTLIELLGVIILLALLVILVFPSIINSVKNSSEKTDELTLELIYNAADLHISNNINRFPKTNGNKFVITLKELVDSELLVSPIKLSDSDEDLTNKKSVQVTYDEGFNYELKDNLACVTSVFGDIDGNGQIEAEDSILLSKYLFYVTCGNLEFDSSLIIGQTDINVDEKTTVSDVNLLSKNIGYITTAPGILGDSNSDGEITQVDVILLQRYIDGEITASEITLSNIDVNGDGEVSAIDITDLQTVLSS